MVNFGIMGKALGVGSMPELTMPLSSLCRVFCAHQKGSAKTLMDGIV